MAKQYSADFFTSLLEAVQKLCREYLDFDQCVDVSGYLALEIDNYKKERFVISELLQSTGDFMSESYCTKAFKTSRRATQRKDSVLKERNPVLERSRCLSISFSHQAVSSESSCHEDAGIASQTNLPSHQSMERDLSFNICQTPSVTSTNCCASQTDIDGDFIRTASSVSLVSSSSQTQSDTICLTSSVSTVSSASQTHTNDSLTTSMRISVSTVGSQTINTGSPVSTISCTSQTYATGEYSLTPGPPVSTTSSASQTHADTITAACQTLVDESSSVALGPPVSTTSSESQTHADTITAACQTLVDESSSVALAPPVSTTSSASQTHADTITAACQTLVDESSSVALGPPVSTTSSESQTHADTITAACQTLVDESSSVALGPPVSTTSSASHADTITAACQTKVEGNVSLTLSMTSSASQTQYDREKSLDSSVSNKSSASQTQYERKMSLDSSVSTKNLESQTQYERKMSFDSSVSTKSLTSQTQSDTLTPDSRKGTANGGKYFTTSSTGVDSTCNSRASRVTDFLSPTSEEIKKHGTKRGVETIANMPDTLQHKIAKKSVLLIVHDSEKAKRRRVVHVVGIDKCATVKHVAGTDKPETFKHVATRTDKLAAVKHAARTDKLATVKHVATRTDKLAAVKHVAPRTDKLSTVKHVAPRTDKLSTDKHVASRTDKLEAVKHVAPRTDKLSTVKHVASRTDKLEGVKHVAGTDKLAMDKHVGGADKLAAVKRVVARTDKVVTHVVVGTDKTVQYQYMPGYDKHVKNAAPVVGDDRPMKHVGVVKNSTAAAVSMGHQDDDGGTQKSSVPVTSFCWEVDAGDFRFHSAERRTLEQKETDVFLTPGTRENAEFCKASICARHRYPFNGVKAHPNFQKAVTAVLEDIPTLSSHKQQVERLILTADRDNRKRVQSRKSSSGVSHVQQSISEVKASTSTVNIQSDSPKCPICYGTGFDRPVIVCSSCDGVYHEDCVVLPAVRKSNWVCSLCSYTGDDFIKTEPMEDLPEEGFTEKLSEPSDFRIQDEQPIGTKTQLEKLLKIFDCKSKAELVKLAQKGIPRHKLSDVQKSLLDSVFYSAFKSDYK